MKRIWIYDTEQLHNFHCSVFIDRHSDDTVTFEISEFKNELKQLQQFVREEVAGLWGWNNHEYDDVIYTTLLYAQSITARDLYKLSQKIIDGERMWSKPPFKTSDLYKMLHFDRFGVSLKWAEVMMCSDSIEEMPVEHWQDVDTRELADKVLYYCTYDVQQTKKVLLRHPEAIEIRKGVEQEYGIRNAYSLSNTSLGKVTMIQDYCSITGDDPYELKNRRTIRSEVYPKDIISDRIQFKTKPLQDFLTYLKNKRVNLVTTPLNEYLYFQGMHYDLKKGGLHGVQGSRTKNGKKYKIDTRLVYESNESQLLLDADFGSFYPRLISVLETCPAHLDKDVFLPLLEKYTIDRLQHKKAGNKVKANDLKIKINSIYGLLGEKNSFLFDLEVMYRITLNGQLILLMLIEELSLLDCPCWYANTDGASFIVNKNKKEIVDAKLKEFSTWIDIELETDIFNKAWIRDVNNFCIIKESGEVKLKGCYEYEDKEQIKKGYRWFETLPINKNNSNLISSKAAVKYLTNKTAITEILDEETSIYPFCIAIRPKKTVKGRPDIMWYHKADRLLGEKQQKTCRYIISKEGGVLKLVYQDGTETHCEAYPHKGQFWFTTIMNKIQDDNKENYDLDYTYYQRETLKLCQFKLNGYQATKEQLKLF